ncbi:hypothetical protein BT69DRAFT_1296532 [Atractiella rhizophila]|nr:hypothetical protein BT69DRAFT_1296532 [Atractiella rhizophila]
MYKPFPQMERSKRRVRRFRKTMRRFGLNPALSRKKGEEVSLYEYIVVQLQLYERADAKKFDNDSQVPNQNLKNKEAGKANGLHNFNAIIAREKKRIEPRLRLYGDGEEETAVRCKREWVITERVERTGAEVEKPKKVVESNTLRPVDLQRLRKPSVFPQLFPQVDFYTTALSGYPFTLSFSCVGN